MRLNRKQTLLTFLAIMVLLTVVGYVQRNYFFNPLTFKQDKITYLPWSWYKKPLQLEIFAGGEQGDVYTTQDPAEINFILGELKKAAERSMPIPAVNGPQNHPLVNVDIRRLEDGPHAPGAVLLHAQSDDGLASLRTGQKMEPVLATPELRAFIGKRTAKGS